MPRFVNDKTAFETKLKGKAKEYTDASEISTPKKPEVKAEKPDPMVEFGKTVVQAVEKLATLAAEQQAVLQQIVQQGAQQQAGIMQQLVQVLGTKTEVPVEKPARKTAKQYNFTVKRDVHGKMTGVTADESGD